MAAAATPSTTAPAIPAVDALAAIALTTQPFADIDKVTAMATRPDDDSIYVITQPGQVYRIPKGGAPAVVLDLTGTVSAWEPGSERGLLGLAFSPVDGRMFLYYTDLQAQAHLVSYAVGDDGKPDPASVWKVMDIAEPGVGHKGGGISFDDDGTLYLALGDGGGSRGHDAQDYDQAARRHRQDRAVHHRPRLRRSTRQPIRRRSEQDARAVGEGPAQPLGLLA